MDAVFLKTTGVLELRLEAVDGRLKIDVNPDAMTPGFYDSSLVLLPGQTIEISFEGPTIAVTAKWPADSAVRRGG